MSMIVDILKKNYSISKYNNLNNVCNEKDDDDDNDDIMMII